MGVGRFECYVCGRQASVTAGTVFDKTRTPLRLWFEAAWLMTSQKHGASALGVQRALGRAPTRPPGRCCTASPPRSYVRPRSARLPCAVVTAASRPRLQVVTARLLVGEPRRELGVRARVVQPSRRHPPRLPDLNGYPAQINQIDPRLRRARFWNIATAAMSPPLLLAPVADAKQKPDLQLEDDVNVPARVLDATRGRRWRASRLTERVFDRIRGRRY